MELDFHVHDDWVSVDVSDLDTVHAVARLLLKQQQWSEVVIGLGSIAVQFDPATLCPDEAATLLDQQLASVSRDKLEPVATVTIPICYEEPFAMDSDRIARNLGIEPEEIAAWHSSLEFTVTMLGFMPGFAYLKCGLDIPEIGRLAQPRQSVPAGSVGLIGTQSCIYPFDSPGGWPIIGKTPTRLFDARNNPPALLSAGQSLKFVPITQSVFEDLL